LAFTGTILTTKGLALQAKVQTGTALNFTKVKIGDGQLGSGQSLEALTDLISPKKTLDISAVAVIGDGTSRVRAVVTNTGLAAGFFVREIGLFATDPDDGEILYCVANAGNECDYLPTPTSVAVEQTLDILTAIGNATNVTAVINETIVLATIQDITDHNNNPDAHNLRRWKASRDYVVGDICFNKLLATDSYKYFECVVAGTSGSTEPTWGNVGTLVADGTATWLVMDKRDGTPVGRITHEHVVRPGYLKANGALISRAAYPRLFKFANDNSLIVSEVDWTATRSGMFGAGDGSTTFRVPDLRANFIRALDDGKGIDTARVLGALQASANLQHRHSLLGYTDGTGTQGTAYTPTLLYHGGNAGDLVKYWDQYLTGAPNITDSGTVESRPRNIALLACIKY